MVLVFDLDDTLYDEMKFVESGFKAVSTFLNQNYSICARESFSYMKRRLLVAGRGHIFDDVLIKFGVFSAENVNKCISIYRGHKSNIHLYPEARLCLHRFRRFPLYIVTDGNREVQKRKLNTLRLYQRVKFCYLTSSYGKNKSKPSPYCFFLICKREGVDSYEVVYIGDNPYKDFLGIKPFGFKTVRILNGQFKNVKVAKSIDAEYTLKSLDELTIKFLENMYD